eukprot:TRINITY_DN3241_c0_g1_i1.p1 TRINITY_DN3241_c0_g1~~TRINITY_DN3241_c0_g1_i1.p1  ORF type:complete len:258 (-),score=59.68 TRINITY_DN3241_c0_g1_i1:1193-1966(-)
MEERSESLSREQALQQQHQERLKQYLLQKQILKEQQKQQKIQQLSEAKEQEKRRQTIAASQKTFKRESTTPSVFAKADAPRSSPSPMSSSFAVAEKRVVERRPSTSLQQPSKAPSTIKQSKTLNNSSMAAKLSLVSDSRTDAQKMVQQTPHGSSMTGLQDKILSGTIKSRVQGDGKPSSLFKSFSSFGEPQFSDSEDEDSSESQKAVSLRHVRSSVKDKLSSQRKEDFIVHSKNLSNPHLHQYHQAVFTPNSSSYHS